jgi:hypothetical protein
VRLLKVSVVLYILAMVCCGLGVELGREGKWLLKQLYALACMVDLGVLITVCWLIVMLGPFVVIGIMFVREPNE